MSDDREVSIYKIFCLPEWEAAEVRGVFAGSADDVRDGFLHLSMAEQVRGTVAKHFSGEAKIILVKIDAAALGASLKWEISRGGQAFPHLYAALPMTAVRQVWRLAREDNHYVFPDEIP